MGASGRNMVHKLRVQAVFMGSRVCPDWGERKKGLILPIAFAFLNHPRHPTFH